MPTHHETRDQDGRLAPPPGLSDAARKLWSATVGSYAPDRFSDAHRPMLAALVRAYALVDECARDIEKRGALVAGRDGLRENPACRAMRRATASATGLSTKLGLGVGRRLKEQRREKSALDVMFEAGIDVARLPRDAGGAIAYDAPLFKRFTGLYFVDGREVDAWLNRYPAPAA
ncbi:P27 family phage terminase small subunit [Paraburkholderia sp. JHI869]|uniref:P27 family phage terminase small subunit n=1 Tax=Paraburkholderia sp. JHI869 TaxID=3112959 RepID=UPI00317597F3